MEVKNKIIELGEEKFFREGFYKTRMDDLAAELRMSKKTLYKFFPTKEELVHAIAMHFLNKMKSKILNVINCEKNAIEKIEELLKVLTKTSQKISPSMLNEMQRHFPSIWTEIDNFRTQMMFGNLTKVIEQGKEEKLFLDYPTPIMMNVLVASIRAIVNPEFILSNNFSISDAATTVFKIIIGGMLTEKGKEIFNETFEHK